MVQTNPGITPTTPFTPPQHPVTFTDSSFHFFIAIPARITRIRCGNELAHVLLNLGVILMDNSFPVTDFRKTIRQRIHRIVGICRNFATGMEHRSSLFFHLGNQPAASYTHRAVHL